MTTISAVPSAVSTVADSTVADSTVADSTAAERYAHLTDRRLAAALSTEDEAEADGRLDPLERTTCYTHRRWLHQCVSSPLHVIVVTGHRWCRRCSCAVDVAVDELTGDVALRCPRCREMPPSAASRQLIRCCRASLAAARDDLRVPGPVPGLGRAA